MIKIMEFIDVDHRLSRLYFKRVAKDPEFRKDPKAYIANHPEYLEYVSSDINRTSSIFDRAFESLANSLANTNGAIKNFFMEAPDDQD